MLEAIGPECERIYVIDDGCPENTGDHVEAISTDSRVRVLRHSENQGVGAATLTGYRAAINDNADIIVKIDGDGQMDTRQLSTLIAPILSGEADYTKGNRFFEPESVSNMPTIRLLGNALLSFISKFSSGYWNIFDPTNGFTAIDAWVASRLPLEKLSHGYFFESDLLFRLNTARAVVKDVPMLALYDAEESNLRIGRVIGPFLVKHGINTAKRIVYNYFLRDFSIASIEILLGPPAIAFGVLVGAVHWISGVQANETATSGTVMLAALPIVVGAQLVLAFLAHDMENVPRDPLVRYRDVNSPAE